MIWLIAAAVVAGLPLVFSSAGAISTLNLVCISIVFALSYNMLLGQTGMLSFGHAVYYGLGAFFAIHAMNAIPRLGLPVPLIVVPIVGGVAGLVFAAAIGWVATKRSGTVFSMISLGVSELAVSAALILVSFFGGDDGVSTDRTKLPPFFGATFSTQLEVYYLVAAWSLLAVLMMFAITRTPFGRMCNAVRDNAERTQFVGYDPHVIRYMAFCFAGLFAGIAGALASLSFESANFTDLGWTKSASVIFSSFIGGTGTFFGPVIGAIVVTYLSLSLSDYTSVWQLYFGLLFISVVVYAPGGIGGIILYHLRLSRAGALAGMMRAYLWVLIPVASVLAGAILALEFVVHRLLGETASISVLGLKLAISSPSIPVVSIILIGIGAVILKKIWKFLEEARSTAEHLAQERGVLL
ncbi:branched-chain amino acid ABC transporter permease [Bradyrhizobium sp. G127]|uniref:branched-chain amino acid ABC transporter permease n=1 Tax=Bradyrhizobium sp. G127 TaxID=2904800 RepID=UPI001F43C5D0|nr:branched-chain amino acid ABC transporter permease [Bradyrhizobium sp. G127]MCF2524888.1 branched-chain amino acid ABC transporter permease [Bradyrhizobium sp. G127]